MKVSTNSGLYIVASDLIKQLEIRFQVCFIIDLKYLFLHTRHYCFIVFQKSITVHSEIPSELLSKLRYKQPWERDQILNVYKSESIELAGTGLLHSVPGHGHEDFVMALTNKLEVVIIL